MARQRSNGYWDGLKRATRYRLIVPLKRSKHPPEYRARGVAVGLFWAFTPTVGVQMPLCLLTWFPAKLSPRTDFSVIIAMAWTWITNVFTMVPIYYVFYLAGQVMLGRWHDMSGYATFTNTWERAFGEAENMIETVEVLVEFLALDIGLAMWVGSIPFAIGLAILGYYLSMDFMRRRRAKRAQRAAG